MKKYFETRASADAAARRELKSRFGKSYMAKATVDFIVCRCAFGDNYGKWRVEFMI